MRILLPLMAIGGIGLLARIAPQPELPLIDALDECVQQRFAEPLPNALGMSRILRPNSFGKHFQPLVSFSRDFEPGNAVESRIVATLEERQVHVGFYLFGAAILRAELEQLSYRGLKGPGVITKGTPRPLWYPGSPFPPVEASGALPDWKAIYPLARKAMASFADGGKGFETVMDSWNIAARPVPARQSCLRCHSAGTIGGVLYAFRAAQ